MIIELGHFALILALAVALVQMLLPAWGAHLGDARLMAVAPPAALAQLTLLTFSFLSLTHAFITSDFSVETVWANSHSAKPLIYKFSGVWGNHEGSMLLWVLILAAFGAAVALFGRNLPDILRANVLAVQAAIAVAFLVFIVFASSPFGRIPPQAEGRGLNPILQDPALAFHPPFLYAGYVGLSMAFSFAIAALIEGRTDAAWARWVQALDARRLDVAYTRHRHGILVGLLRTGLGWLVVLGPRRECLLHAVAGGHRPVALGAGDGEA